ncbi:hypothetical protein Trydic_g8186 [Trypoxylus dichotomus]
MATKSDALEIQLFKREQQIIAGGGHIATQGYKQIIKMLSKIPATYSHNKLCRCFYLSGSLKFLSDSVYARF